MLPVSPDCPFPIVPSVLSKVHYLQLFPHNLLGQKVDYCFRTYMAIIRNQNLIQPRDNR